MTNRRDNYREGVQKSWMFKQEAEDHYFGSIVAMNPRASAIGGVPGKMKNQF